MAHNNPFAKLFFRLQMRLSMPVYLSLHHFCMFMHYTNPRNHRSSRTNLRFKQLLCLSLCCALLAACSNPKKNYDNRSPKDIYADAQDHANSNDWEKAIPLFEKLEGRAAGTPLAQQAQLEKAYAYYKDGQQALAIATLDRFERLHPTSPAMDYALYLKGLVSFNDDMGIFGMLSEQDLSERDQKQGKQAFLAFKELTERYPDSKYTPDAKARMQYIVNSLAQGQVNIARYYLKRRAYVAAINRAQTALANYPETPALEEALYVLVKSYDALEMKQLSEDSKRVLAKSYPESNILKTGIAGKKTAWWKPW